MSIPTWYDEIRETPYVDEPYYIITYKFTQAQHDGYNSECYDTSTEYENIEWISTIKVGYLPKQVWDFNNKIYKLAGRVSCTNSCHFMSIITIKHMNITIFINRNNTIS